jgi:hypothetical protein
VYKYKIEGGEDRSAELHILGYQSAICWLSSPEISAKNTVICAVKSQNVQQCRTIDTAGGYHGALIEDVRQPEAARVGGTVKHLEDTAAAVGDPKGRKEGDVDVATAPQPRDLLRLAPSAMHAVRDAEEHGLGRPLACTRAHACSV